MTLKQQVEAIIRSGMAAWMSAHALISPRPSGPPESACMRCSSEEPRHGVKLFSPPPPSLCLTESPLFLCSTRSLELLFHNFSPHGSPFTFTWNFPPVLLQTCSPLTSSCFSCFSRLKVLLSKKSLSSVTLLYPSMHSCGGGGWGGTGVPVLVGVAASKPSVRSGPFS